MGAEEGLLRVDCDAPLKPDALRLGSGGYQKEDSGDERSDEKASS